MIEILGQQKMAHLWYQKQGRYFALAHLHSHPLSYGTLSLHKLHKQLPRIHSNQKKL